MAEKVDFFTLTVPFSSIPVRYSEPLSIETEMEYTLEEKKFPGLHDNQHILQPALVIAKSQDSCSDNDQNNLNWSNCAKVSCEDSDPTTQQSSCRGMPPQAQEMLPTLSEARGQFAAFLSDIAKHGKAFRDTPNFPALPSAISWDKKNDHIYSAHLGDICPSRTTHTRLSCANRRQTQPMGSFRRSVMAADRASSAAIQDGRHGCHVYNNVQNQPSVNRVEMSRKRSFHTETEPIDSDIHRFAKRRKTDLHDNSHSHYIWRNDDYTIQNCSYRHLAEMKPWCPKLNVTGNLGAFNFYGADIFV